MLNKTIGIFKSHNYLILTIANALQVTSLTILLHFIRYDVNNNSIRYLFIPIVLLNIYLVITASIALILKLIDNE
jgi:hypothetical protein